MNAALCLVAVLQGNLIANGSFDADARGWTGQTKGYARSAGRTSGSLHLAHKGGDGIQVCRYRVPKMPKGKALKLTLWIKGSNVTALAGACIQGWDEAQSKIADFASTQTSSPLKGSFDWTKVETLFNPGSDTASAHVLLMLVGDGEAWFDDISLVEAGESKPGGSLLGGAAPGLFEVRGETTLTAAKDSAPSKLRLPMPLDYREQVPLSYTAFVTPAQRATGYRVYEDQPGNYVLQIDLAAMKAGEKVDVAWSSAVLAAPRREKLPASATYPKEWPAEAKPWLASTWCIQSGDPKFVAIGKELRSGSDDVVQVVNRAIEKAKAIMSSQTGMCTKLDALEALEKQGSCTSNANLVAALIRSAGVPARVLAGYPSWSGPLQTHYNVEAFVPGYGWYLIESTLLQPWTPAGQIQVSIVPPAYEDRAQGRFPAAPGVPYLTLTEFEGPATFGWFAKVDGKDYCDHVCTAVKPYVGNPVDWEAALEAGRKHWRLWLKDVVGFASPRAPRFGTSVNRLKGENLADLPAAIGG